MTENDDWTLDHDKLVAFGRHLIDRHGFDIEDLQYYYQKPWKWTEAFHSWWWERHGQDPACKECP